LWQQALPIHPDIDFTLDSKDKSMATPVLPPTTQFIFGNVMVFANNSFSGREAYETVIRDKLLEKDSKGIVILHSGKKVRWLRFPPTKG
jgi:hypothetical protein